MSGNDADVAELNALRREVQLLRDRVAELQRSKAAFDRSTAADAQALVAREELLHEAERVAHLGTWTWDFATDVVTWSDELYRILGLEPGSLTPSVEAFYARVHPEDLEHAEAELRHYLECGVLGLVECRVVRPDGSVRHTAHSSSMLYDAAGNQRCIVGGVLDRTEPIEAEKKLRRTLALLEEAQRFGKLGSWRVDARTGALEWSKEFRRIAGLAEDAVPDIDLFMGRVVEEDRARLMEEYLESVTQVEGGEAFGRLRMPDGEIRHIRIQGFVVDGADGRPELRGTMADITEQVRLREERVHAQKMEAVGRLAGGIAHDFNNLLTVVNANLELLSEEVGDNSRIDDSLQALESASNLTRRLLAFGRQAQLSLRSVRLNDLVRSTMAMMQRLVGDEVVLEVELGADLPPVRADPLEIERALINLVVNARDAMPEGGRVHIGTHEDTWQGAPAVALAVGDRGPGIPDADRLHIFEPFFTTRHHVGGTGLGLATVLGTAEQHGGTVRVEPRAGGGSVFTILLPATEDRASVPLPPPPPKAEQSSGVRRLQVLVVDDEPRVAEVTRHMLEAQGHSVIVASQSDEALRLWRERGPEIDLVICDVVMAPVRGPELVEWMAAEDHGPPRVLFMTGYSEEGAQSELEHPVIAKPFNMATLREAVLATTM